jgi:hypothetical protein
VDVNSGRSICFFTGSPTDKAIWLLLGGIVVIIIGLAGLLRGQPKGV